MKYLIKTLLHTTQYELLGKQAIIGNLKRAAGVDVSHYNAEFNPDNAQPGLLDFGITKATEGVSYNDPDFENLYNQVSKLAVNGAYHYLRSQYPAADQANFFLNTIAGKKLDILAIDFEGIGNVMNDAFVKILHATLVAVSNVRTECKVMLYTNPNWYDTIIYPAMMRIWGRDVFHVWDLWLAQYPWIVNVDGMPALPKNRKDWKIWQYSEASNPDAYGSPSHIDADIFNGTRDELLAWVGKSSTPIGEPVIEDKYYKVNVGVSSLNIRSSAENLGTTNDLGTFNLTAGDVIHTTAMIINGTSTFHQIVKIWRGGVILPFAVVSPTGQYWCVEKDVYGTYLTETTNPVPTPSTLPVLHVTIAAEGYPTTMIDINPL